MGKYDGGTSNCQWSSSGHVNGGSSIPTASASANCYASGECDGWNWGEDCSGALQPIPSPSPSPPSPPSPPAKWKLIWSDEFDACPHGRPDPANWGYEHGYCNHEQQWYQEDNAACVNGTLVITARREHPSEKPSFDYTSSSLISKGKKQFQFGRLEMRGKIPVDSGSWPAWWTLGANTSLGWPKNGEIDIMEYYRGNVLANFDYGDSQGRSVWNSHRTPVSQSWASEFHVWAMEWDANDIKLFLDGKMVNHESVASADGTGHANPWREFPVFMILNLAIGGQNGGDPSKTKFPLKYYVDYVRVYQNVAEQILV